MTGVVILMMIFAATYLINELIKGNLEKQAGFLPKSALKNQITLCVENTGSFALLKMGMQGGHIQLSRPYLNDSNLKVAYAYDNGSSLASIDRMTEELSDFMDKNMILCIYKYVENRQRDYELEFGNVTTKTIIAEEDVTFEVHFPVNVIQNNTIDRLEFFGAKVPVRLAKVHRMITKLLEKKKENDFDVYHDCFYDPLMDIGVVDYGHSTLFILEDKGSRFKNIESKAGPYRFLFAVKN